MHETELKRKGLPAKDLKKKKKKTCGELSVTK